MAAKLVFPKKIPNGPVERLTDILEAEKPENRFNPPESFLPPVSTELIPSNSSISPEVQPKTELSPELIEKNKKHALKINKQLRRIKANKHLLLNRLIKSLLCRDAKEFQTFIDNLKSRNPALVVDLLKHLTKINDVDASIEGTANQSAQQKQFAGGLPGATFAPIVINCDNVSKPTSIR